MKAGVKLGSVAALALALAACATKPKEADQVAQVTVLEEDARIPFVDTISGYQLSPDEEGVVFRAPGGNWYLVEVWQPCRSDLRFAQAIGVQSTVGQTFDKFSRLIVRGQSCPIERIARIADPRAPAPAAATPAPAAAPPAG